MKKLKREKRVPLTEEHHRRPRSLGGTDSPSNVSYVLQKVHKSWHVLFGNMNAEQICNKINSSLWKPEGVTVICVFINGKEVLLRGKNNSRKESKCLGAWNILFRDLSFEEIIGYINNVWIDPSYHLYIK